MFFDLSLQALFVSPRSQQREQPLEESPQHSH
jgi:hypothetical protein